MSDLFAQRLKYLRGTSKKTQSHMANLLHISIRQYQLYESGQSYPAFHGLIILSNYFGVSLDYLTGRSDDPQYEKYLQIAEDIILSTEATYFVPKRYKNLDYRVENHSIKERMEILLTLYDALDDYYERRARYKEAMKEFEPTLYNELLKRGKYYLQKIGLIGPTIYHATDKDSEEYKRAIKIGKALHKLFPKDIDE
ncbi:helix-turn-helix domain-containing protein [Pelosinus propionicus]|uniref:Transcriptional regulator, contains XRE-family HTH domain n=1 Tax=Pelosinus propionicus DSM 13327 TaxID=1123291 RepID=A0A1I4HRL9_9FIRM|nr:helix-turn-helix transcriptional regulator [Pelosinus propionicus]SFL43996.1 Transcriptional regulator, contains XRE-family HTH domain [Pelosinus propionicus DSM 13327]